MPIDIEDLLNRRTDLSTFVVHLTKDGDKPAKDNLLAILKAGAVKAGQPMGWVREQALEIGGDALESQRVVCFSETPLEHLYAMFAEIKDREVKLQPFGIAFTKVVARRNGANPVWYVNMTPGFDWVVSPALNRLRKRAVRVGLHRDPAGCLFPYIEGMGDWRGSTGRRKEFWWEREWRHVGDFAFHMEDIALVIAPASEHAEFDKISGGRTVDGSWSLERIIAKLSGVAAAGQVTPVSAH